MTIALTMAQAAAPSDGAAIFMNIAPLLLIFVVFYFLLIRPQQRRVKEHQAKVGAAKRGDMVVTGGGLIGKVTKVMDDRNEVEVEIASGVKVRAVKTTLSDVLTPQVSPAND